MGPESWGTPTEKPRGGGWGGNGKVPGLRPRAATHGQSLKKKCPRFEPPTGGRDMSSGQRTSQQPVRNRKAGLHLGQTFKETFPNSSSRKQEKGRLITGGGKNTNLIREKRSASAVLGSPVIENKMGLEGGPPLGSKLKQKNLGGAPPKVTKLEGPNTVTGSFARKEKKVRAKDIGDCSGKKQTVT